MLTDAQRRHLDHNDHGVHPSAIFSGDAKILTERIGGPTARIMSAIAGEPAGPMSDESLAEIGRVILAISIGKVSAANYLEGSQ